jgi:VWFA-related protein
MLSRRHFLYLAGVSAARAQDTQFATGVNVVNVLATVRDKQGKIIHDLAQDEFTIQEDGRPQSIRYFSQQSDLPLTLGLLLDTSGSQTRVLDRERNASYEFFEHILREDKDKAFLIHFDREVELLQDLTSSRKDLEAALRDAERPQLNRRTPGTSPSPGGGGGRGQGRGNGGGTAMYDAIFLAADEILKKQQGRKAVVLLSDGVDNGSKTSIGGAIESAQRADMLVYSIRFADTNSSPVGFGGPGIGRGGRRGGGGGRFPQQQRREPVDGKKILERISQETGGAYFEVSGKMPLDKIYDQIEEELRNQYNLGYTPDQSSGGYHKILVSLKRKGLTVRARDGYYT